MQQHQNFSEQYYQTIKTSANCILDQFGAPAETWLLALKYVAYILNRVAHESLGYKTPLQALNGQRPDISALLRFHFWQPVYYTLDEDENTGYSQPEENWGDL